MKNSYLKIFVALLFLQSNMTFADLNTSATQIKTNISGEETCTPSANVVADEHGPGYDQAYENCKARNKNRNQANKFINESKDDASQINNGTVGAAPVNNCAAEDYGCEQQYQKSVEAYNRKVNAGNQVSAAQTAAAASVTEEQKKIAELNDKTASGSQAEIQQKSGDGETLYKVAGAALAGFAAYKFTEASAYAGPCFSTGISCQAMAAAVVGGVAFMLLNKKANDQADELCAAKTQACESGNQMSSTQKTCEPCKPAGDGSFGGGGGGGGIADGGGIFNPPPDGNYWDNDGKCLPSAPPVCVNKPPGSGSTAGKLPSQCAGKTGATAVSCLAGLPGAYKQNANGSITVKGLKGDKTYTLDDFADKKSMMALGMSAADADKLMNDLYGANSALAKAGLDAKDLAKNGDKKFSDFSSSGGSSSTGLTGGGVTNPNKNFGDKLGDVASRKPTSEGLTRDYNGDLIGAAGDDIFSMMNRRYNLKSQQDSFIAP